MWRGKPSVCGSLAVLACLGGRLVFAHEVGLETSADRANLSIGHQTWCFRRADAGWALQWVEVDGKAVARPLSETHSFFEGGGRAERLEILTNTPTAKALRFVLGTNAVTYAVHGNEPLPVTRVSWEGPSTITCAWRTMAEAADAHGAWVTRGYVATDADRHEEAFIDGSGPMVLGHSVAGDCDTAYVFLPKVNPHVQPNGRTEQRSDTWFKSWREPGANGRHCGAWQWRMGRLEPKECAVVFDRDLGGRVSSVAEKYFAGAVDMLVDMTSVPTDKYDPERCLQVLPVRLAAPDAFIPGWGWMMDEFPGASYPYAHDSVWQPPALLAFEGLATGRAWEANFARYLLDHTPLEGPDGKSYFVRRPGGLTRWGYFATYRDGFPPMDGGTWWLADLLHRTAVALGHAPLRQAALDMVRHDLEVKLDLNTMTYPPCWSARSNSEGVDHRDDWFKTPGLAYCAYMAAKVAYPETGDAKYLRMADQICDWFAAPMLPERQLNHLQGNNMHAVFSHYIALMFLDRYERTRERRFLDLARDMAWIHIMTTCTTPAQDSGGHPMTGATCVGIRGCVDYDCAPNLCHEKDLTFVHLIGPLLDHVQGPAYAKYIALNRLTLAKDSWTSAWAADLRDTNLRTMYDTYARGMANLIHALSLSENPGVIPVDMLVSKSDTNIVCQRDLVLANGAPLPRASRVRIRFLHPGQYAVTEGDRDLGPRTAEDLAQGLEVRLNPNEMRRIRVRAVRLEPPAPATPPRYAPGTTHLGDLEPYAVQRATGNPQPVYHRDRGFGGQPLSLGGRTYTRGLGCAANTVLIYDLHGRHERFKAVVGVDDFVGGRTNPPPSVHFTVHVDGRLQFESGAMFSNTPPRAVDVDVRQARMLMLRMSCNWDDEGRSLNDHGDWADARLEGTAEPH